MVSNLSLTLLLLGCCLAADSSEKCKDFCITVLCANESPETCTQQGKEYRANGGTCGCCNICVNYIEENGDCSPDALDGGEYAVKQNCRPGTECRDGKCTRQC